MQSRLQGLREGENEQGNHVYDVGPTTRIERVKRIKEIKCMMLHQLQEPRVGEKEQGNQVYHAEQTTRTESGRKGARESSV